MAEQGNDMPGFTRGRKQKKKKKWKNCFPKGELGKSLQWKYYRKKTNAVGQCYSTIISNEVGPYS